MTAYDSIKADFEDFLTHELDGGPPPTVTEDLGPAWGYHVWDLGLAQDNLVSDVAAAEMTWTQDHR